MKTNFRYKKHYSIPLRKELIDTMYEEATRGLNSAIPYRHYLNQGTGKIIQLISPGGRSIEAGGVSTQESFKATKYLKSCPTISKFLESLPGKKFSCRISLIQGGGGLLPHRDFFRNIEFGVVRLHIPLQTNKKFNFNIGGKNFFLKKYHAHFVDVSKVHFVTNDCSEDRIHIIIDIEVTEQLIGLFKFPKTLNQLHYLDTKKARHSLPLKEIVLKIPKEYLPYTLTTRDCKIVQKKKKWFFVTDNYEFEIIKAKCGGFNLDTVGPGWVFYLSENSIHILSSGLPVFGKNNIINGTVSTSIKF